VLLTTQYLEEADRLCKQLVVLNHGKIIAEGTSSQLKSSLGNTVLVLTFASTGDSQRAPTLISDLSSKPANVDGTVIELTVDKGLPPRPRRFVELTPRDHRRGPATSRAESR
jgi:ABC-2 type transport system ATP-binding protein